MLRIPKRNFRCVCERIKEMVEVYDAMEGSSDDLLPDREKLRILIRHSVGYLREWMADFDVTIFGIRGEDKAE